MCEAPLMLRIIKRIHMTPSFIEETDKQNYAS